MTLKMQDAKHKLEFFISYTTGSPVEITLLELIPGGASRETWAVDALVSSGPQAGKYRLVMRRDMGSSMLADALQRHEEFMLLRVAHGGDVLVPMPRWLCTDPQILERPFFLMDRVEGESIGRRIVRLPDLAEARRRLPGQMARQLALIHELTLDNPELLFLRRPPSGLSPAQAALQATRNLVQDLNLQNPALELGLRWLEAHTPACPPQDWVVVHGDFRVGNLMVGPEDLVAVLDWEFAHVGDPHEDLAWPMVRDWRFGNDRLPVAGVGEVEDFIVPYELASGRRVDRAALRFWEIFGNLRWAVICMSQAQRHLSGHDLSVELASLGRRAAEMEWEYLTLIREDTPVNP